MRGYLSFVLVLLSLLLVFSLLELNFQEESQKAVIVERSYSVSMNVKECILETLRQGARKGFSDYDQSHDITLCKHCPPCAPQSCNMALCNQCFREQEARDQAESYALSNLDALRYHTFDSDFEVSVKDAEITVFLEARSAKNGLGFSMLRIDEDMVIDIKSEKFGTEGNAKVPRGMIVYDSDS